MTTRTKGLLGAACLALATAATAQYKYVGPDGRVTYSDKPAPPSERVVSQRKLNETSAAPTTPLPFELQQAVAKYPVTLYTGEKCTPCNDARNYLRNRGVPFTEKTVTSDDDIALFRQQSPDGTAPVVTVGGRRAVGFAETSWSTLLDGAGYPQTSGLPRDFQNPVPTPLSPNTRPAAQNVATSPPTAARTPPTVAAPAPAPNPPPGFRF